MQGQILKDRHHWASYSCTNFLSPQPPLLVESSWLRTLRRLLFPVQPSVTVHHIVPQWVVHQGESLFSEVTVGRDSLTHLYILSAYFTPDTLSGLNPSNQRNESLQTTDNKVVAWRHVSQMRISKVLELQEISWGAPMGVWRSCSFSTWNSLWSW